MFSRGKERFLKQHAYQGNIFSQVENQKEERFMNSGVCVNHKRALQSLRLLSFLSCYKICADACSAFYEFLFKMF